MTGRPDLVTCPACLYWALTNPLMFLASEARPYPYVYYEGGLSPVVTRSLSFQHLQETG